MRRLLTALLVASMSGLLAGCGTPESIDGRDDQAMTVDQARSELRGYIEDVTAATASRYNARDDRGHEMDGVKIIAAPENGGFVGLYHSWRDDTQDFRVHVATSSDLVNWAWQVELARQASMPTIKPATDGGYVAAWEQEPDNHLTFAYYPTWSSLLSATPSKTVDVAQTLSNCAEGTPNLYSASSTSLDVGFHFYDDCQLDRQAHGTTNWTSWTAEERPSLDEPLLQQGVQGGIGDRDVIDFGGHEFTLIEGQAVLGDWRTWDVYLHDAETNTAERLDFRTAAGSSAFTNPTIEQVEVDGQPALVVSLFVPQEGAGGAEAGELIYYRAIGN